MMISEYSAPRRSLGLSDMKLASFAGETPVGTGPTGIKQFVAVALMLSPFWGGFLVGRRYGWGWGLVTVPLVFPALAIINRATGNSIRRLSE